MAAAWIGERLAAGLAGNGDGGRGGFARRFGVASFGTRLGVFRCHLRAIRAPTFATLRPWQTRSTLTLHCNVNRNFGGIGPSGIWLSDSTVSFPGASSAVWGSGWERSTIGCAWGV